MARPASKHLAKIYACEQQPLSHIIKDYATVNYAKLQGSARSSRRPRQAPGNACRNVQLRDDATSPALRVQPGAPAAPRPAPSAPPRRAAVLRPSTGRGRRSAARRRRALRELPPGGRRGGRPRRIVRPRRCRRRERRSRAEPRWAAPPSLSAAVQPAHRRARPLRCARCVQRGERRGGGAELCRAAGLLRGCGEE